MKHIEALERLTHQLPSLPTEKINGDVVIEMIEGEGIGTCLHTEPLASVARWRFTAGSVAPSHQHSEKEWLIVLKGAMRLNLASHGQADHFEYENVILRDGDYFYIEAGMPHNGEFFEDTILIGVAVPESKDFPNGSAS